ncbi:MAG: GDP-mannose 4,6-dehydratase [Planctomycetes bacterium]|nr:GDP-mannose 4,6-dehydratase [Planctomycetota bacterium]
MRILVTGITGFAGGHLAEALLVRGGADLVGVSRAGAWPEHWRHLAGRVALRSCDLANGSAVEALLREVQPQQIYHMAGYAQVGASFREVDTAWAGNLTATRSLYEAIHRWGGRPRVLYVGSGLIYGDPEKPGQAFAEDHPLRPTSPYASSKAAADLLSFQMTRAPGLDIVRARPFNHIGPHQSPQFAVPHFAQQIAAIERRSQPPILETGNLTPWRDLSDVRDVVRAYTLLMDRGQNGEAYNIATGEVHSVKEVLDRLLALANVQVEVRQSTHLIRPNDTPAVRGDAAKLRRETGWAPRFPLDQTLADTLAYWRQRV